MSDGYIVQPVSTMKKEKELPESAKRFEALRSRFNLTQQQVADRSGNLERVEVNSIATGKNKGSSYRVVSGLAKAFDLDPNGMSEYLDGKIELDALLAMGKRAKPNVELATLDWRYPERQRAMTTPLIDLLPPPVLEALMSERRSGKVPNDELWWVERAIRLYDDYQSGTGVFAPEEEP